MASPAKKSCKQNFSASEISVLTEKYKENVVILQSKFTFSKHHRSEFDDHARSQR